MKEQTPTKMATGSRASVGAKSPAFRNATDNEPVFGTLLKLIRGEDPLLDVGCGSSRSVGALPLGSVAVDVLRPKLPYVRLLRRALVQGSAVALSFRDDTFSCNAG